MQSSKNGDGRRTSEWVGVIYEQMVWGSHTMVGQLRIEAAQIVELESW